MIVDLFEALKKCPVCVEDLVDAKTEEPQLKICPEFHGMFALSPNPDNPAPNAFFMQMVPEEIEYFRGIVEASKLTRITS